MLPPRQFFIGARLYLPKKLRKNIIYQLFRDLTNIYGFGHSASLAKVSPGTVVGPSYQQPRRRAAIPSIGDQANRARPSG
jgi:hypothetical protein